MKRNNTCLASSDFSDSELLFFEVLTLTSLSNFLSRLSSASLLIAKLDSEKVESAFPGFVCQALFFFGTNSGACGFMFFKVPYPHLSTNGAWFCRQSGAIGG
ncbi:hypothetical protein CFOL_v3_21702 [Cephalotus follicularis]|uniref:Uncharacterized protein n=1 Tax=Cephalotus follicularis TaxID=3775 RepID=A0A1Q3CDB6_CEPFO|nr:hypothetical protein CFOL_v3_21702 [Cephalotus follicularis]